MTKRVLLLIAFCLFCCANLSAQDKKQPEELKGGIIYGKDHVFALSAPKDWVLDNTSGVKMGLHAVFYPKGSSWENGAAIMYANTIRKNLEQKETLNQVIEFDLEGYKKHSPTVKIADAGQLPTKRDEQKAVVKYFTGDRTGRYEAVAYIDEKKTVIVLVLTAKTKKDFEDALPSFKELVASYFFISDKVIIETDK
jgi:hypothetical protein